MDLVTSYRPSGNNWTGPPISDMLVAGLSPEISGDSKNGASRWILETAASQCASRDGPITGT